MIKRVSDLHLHKSKWSSDNLIDIIIWQVVRELFPPLSLSKNKILIVELNWF